MLKKVAMVFGVVFLLIGLLGFVPGITSTGSDGMQLLLGLFMVDSLHNTIHLVSGVVGLAAAANDKYAKWYLVGFGVIYALIAVVGFMDPTIFGMLQVNAADNWLHLVFAVGLLGAGLGLRGEGPGDMAMPKKVM